MNVYYVGDVAPSCGSIDRSMTKRSRSSVVRVANGLSKQHAAWFMSSLIARAAVVHQTRIIWASTLLLFGTTRGSLVDRPSPKTKTNARGNKTRAGDVLCELIVRAHWSKARSLSVRSIALRGQRATREIIRIMFCVHSPAHHQTTQTFAVGVC